MERKALVTDDQVSIRKSIRKILEKLNYHVVEASDGQEAVDLFSKNKFDLLTMDHQMPKLMGAQAVIKIREKNIEVPIICISSSISTMRPHIKHLPNLYFLDKPVDAKELQETIAQINELGSMRSYSGYLSE